MLSSKTKIVLISLIIGALPLWAWASGEDPMITKVTVKGPYQKGAAFSISVENFGDLEVGKLEVIFPDKQKAQITGKKSKTIEGVVPDDILPQGGKLIVTLDKKTAEFRLKVPHITQVFTPENTKSQDLIVISGENFDPAKCQASLGTGKLKIQKCDNTQILVKIETKIESGDVVVASYGFSSAPYPFKVNAPKIDFIESAGGLKPGAIIRIHGSGFKSAGVAPEVMLEKTRLKLLNFSEDGTLAEAQLPSISFTGKIIIARGGLESNSVKIESEKAPILTSYTEERQQDGTVMLTLMGKNFSEKPEENSVSLGKSKSKVVYAETTKLQAPLPTNIEDGCLLIAVKNIRSNCLYFAPKEAPTLSRISEPSLDNEGNYTVMLYGSGFGDKINTTAYLKGAKQDIVGILGDGQMTIRPKALPKNGAAYIVSNGVKSNELPFDFSDVGIPFIAKITAPQGFSPGQPITIEGVNFERNANRKKVKVNLNNGGISTQDFRTDPLKITTYLDYKGTLFKETTLSVTVNSKKSNELVFPFDPKLTTVYAGPVIKKISAPEGIMEGSTIVIEGNGFATNPTENTVFFKDQQAKAAEVKGGKLMVKLPEGVKSGELHVEANNQKSNELAYLAAPKKAAAFTLDFQTLEKNSFDLASSTKKMAVLAKIALENYQGRLQIKKWTFDIVIANNPEAPESLQKSGVIPLEEISLTNKSVKGFEIKPAIAKCNLGRCQVTFINFILPPAAEKQTYEISTVVSPFILDGSEITLATLPGDPNDLSAENLEKGDGNITDFSNLKQITSPPLTVINENTACFDSEEDRRNCNAWLTGKTPVTSPSTITAAPLTPPPAPESEQEPEPAPEPEPSAPALAPEPEPKESGKAERVEASPTKATPPKKTTPTLTAPVTPVTVTKKRPRKTLVPKTKTGEGPLIPFRDAAEVPWAQKYLNAMKSKQIVGALPENAFRPSVPITRIDLLAYALNGFQIDASGAETPSLNFSDISKEDPLAKLVAWSRENGVIKGYNDGTFRPDAPVTRAEAVKIILLAGGFKLQGNTANPFSDLAEWQIPWVSEAFRRGIVRGVSVNKFDPNRSVTRAEAAKIILETIDKYAQEVTSDQEFEFEVNAEK